MHNHKASYSNTYKQIIFQLLLNLFLFANCDTKLDLASIPIDSGPAQPPIALQTYTSAIAYGKEEMKDVLDQVTSSSRKRKRLVLTDGDKEELRPVVKKIDQECYVEQEEGFSNLPIELQAYILSFLDGKDFHRASLVCHGWRDAAFIVGETKALDLSRKKLDAKDCQVLLKAPFCSLILKECRLEDQEMLILSRSRRIKRLDLFKNKIGPARAQMLASGNLAALTFLELGCNRIGPSGVWALANGNLTALTSLNLYNNRIGATGAHALANGNLAALTFLELGCNKIKASGVQALANGNLTALASLNLYNNGIGDSGAQALANGNLVALTSLHLAGNCIGAAGAQALANGNLTALISLNLYHNRIEDAGAEALAKGNFSSLSSLNLAYNNIGVSGIHTLFSDNLAALTSLDLEGNNIGDENKKTLEAWEKKKFIKLEF